MRIFNLFILFPIITLLNIQFTLANSFNPNLKAYSVVTISQNWDLKGNNIIIPEGVTLLFTKGSILNGTLTGSMTKIQGNVVGIFNKVTVAGSWNVPEITTDMFVDLNYDNSLRDVIALADSSVWNNVTIAEGDYFFSLNKANKTGIKVCSKTLLTINGNLLLRGNNLRSYDIVRVEGTNIAISGKGAIVGDRYSHVNDGGEWGMGIGIYNSDDVSIRGLKVNDCWGDCIYIGNKTGKVVIEGCKLLRGRRQGISITSAKNVLIANTYISEIGGTSPEYAIDIEPNDYEKIGSVRIINVHMHDCSGGITSLGVAKGANINVVEVEYCKVTGKLKYYPYRFRHQRKLSMKYCMAQTDKRPEVLLQNVKIVRLLDVDMKNSWRPFRIQKCDSVRIE